MCLLHVFSKRSFMQKAYCHITQDAIHHTPASKRLLGQFPLRALLCASDDEYVILPDMDMPHEELAMMDRLDIGPHPDLVCTHLFSAPHLELFPFSGTSSQFRKLAERFGYQVHAPHQEICWRANDKGELQTVCGGMPGARLPYGCVCRPYSVDAGVHMIHFMRSAPVRVKATLAAGGYQQCVVLMGETYDCDLPRRRGSTRFVLQEEMSHDFVASLEFYIRPNGTYEILVPTLQYIHNEKTHFGNYYSELLGTDRHVFSRDILDQLIDSTRVIINQFLIPLGFYGYATTDAVINSDAKQVYIVEVNARVSASFYPIKAWKTWYQERVSPFDMQSFVIPQGMPGSVLMEHFEGLLFDRSEQIGFIPFCFLPQQGFCYGVTFAPTNDELVMLSKEVDARKASLLA